MSCGFSLNSVLCNLPMLINADEEFLGNLTITFDQAIRLVAFIQKVTGSNFD
jgi:hypothetical protein